MTRIARLTAVLLISAVVVSVASLTTGAATTHRTNPEPSGPLSGQADSEVSVRCLPFGLYGDITANVLVDRLSDSGEQLAFVGTSNGLYVVSLDGKLRHFLYSPFGVRFVALIDDVTGDGIREAVVVLNSTQVPALRCYDGASWEKVWQFAPVAKVWDDTWVKRQMGITSLQVMEDGDSQSVVIISGRSVFSVDAKEGIERWRSSALHIPKTITVVADLNSDGTDEVFLATQDGYIRLLNGNTGKARWRTRLPEITVYNETIQSTAEHVLTLDSEEGMVAVASSDGIVRLFDLNAQKLEWEVSLPTPKGVPPGPMALVPNPTADGQSAILVSYSSPTPLTSGVGETVKNRVALLDAAGNKLWDRDSDAWGLSSSSYGGKPAVIVPTAEEIKLVDLADGESVVKTIPVSTPDEWGADVRQIGENAFLLVGSLTAISSTGDVLWHYPRIANVKALPGNFVGDATEDVLFSAEWKTIPDSGYTPPVNDDGIVLMTTGTPYQGYQPEEPKVRLLKVTDGATGEIAWSYEVPLNDLKSSGGLKGIKVTADLVGNDGVQDIIGYREDTIFIFSGKDGSISSFSSGQPVESLDIIRNGASGNAVAVSSASGLTVFDGMGMPLWATAGEEWVEDEPVKFIVLDDLNSDTVSDLAILSPRRIVLLRSTDNATGYELHLAFDPETECLIEYVELVPDANGDGVREMAYIQRSPGSQQPDKYVPPGCPVLVKQSAVGGEQLLRVALPTQYPTVDLTSGDFNSDGCADSLVCYNSYESCSQPGSGQNYTGRTLWIISGRDGATIRTRSVAVGLQSYGGSGWGINPPATSIGDVNGDGKDDLAWIADQGFEAYSGYYCHRQRIEIYDVAHDQSLRVIPVTPLLREGGWYSADYAAMLAADIDGDGRSEILVAVSETLTSSYGRGTYEYSPWSSPSAHLAVMDIDSSERLAAFMGISPGSASVFQTHQSGVAGVAAMGRAYFLDTNARFKVTSPADGARTGPVVPVRWEGCYEGDFVQVFVDGVSNYEGNGSGVDLYLARGQHDIVVRSVDDCGRISYGPSDLGSPLTITVTPSPWKPVLLVLTLFVLMAMIVLLFYTRLHRTWRARRRAAKA